MARRVHLTTDLTGGELSPRMAARFDTEVYKKGLARMENFIPFSQGGATLRAGTACLGATAFNTGTRLIPFVISPTKAYILELSNLSMRVLKDGLPLGVPVTWTTPWATAELWAVQFAQISNALVMVHPGYAPRVCTWSSGDTFLTAVGALPSLTFDGPGLVTATGWGANVAAWAATTAYLAGAVVRNAGNYYYCTVAGTSASTAPTLTTYTEAAPFADGTASWRWYQEVPQYDAATWPECVAVFNSRLWLSRGIKVWASAPFDYGNFFFFDIVSYTSKQVKDPKAWFAGALSPAGSVVTTTGLNPLTYLGSVVSGKFKARRSGGTDVYTVTTWNSTTVTFSAALSAADVSASATKFWTFSTWADPSTPEYEDVTIRKDITAPGSAIELELASDQAEAVQWMTPGRALVIGTMTSEWVVPAGVTASNIAALMQTRYGSAPSNQGVLVNDAVVFLQGGGKKVREYFYQNESGAYQSPDLTFVAEHILGTGVKEFDFTQVPEPTVWCVRTDGTLAVLLYNKQAGSRAWCRFTFDAGVTVESLAIIPSATTGDDDVYVVLIRNSVRYVELFKQSFGGWHVDSGVALTYASGTTQAGLARFNYGTPTVDMVDITAGIAYPALALSTDTVTIPAAARVVGHVLYFGRLVNGYLETMPLAVEPKDQGQLKRVARATFRVIGTYPFLTGPLASEAVPMATTTVGFTGDVTVPVPSDWEQRGTLYLKATGLPCTVIGIFTEVGGA